MDGTENSKLQQQQQFTSSPNDLSYPSHFSNLCPLFSTMEFNFNELKNAKADDTGNFNSFTPSTEHSSGYSGHFCAKSDTDSSSEAEAGGDDSSDEELSLEELLIDEKAQKKIELLAAMVGVDTTEPAIVLTEVVRVLKHFKKIYLY